MPTFVRSRLAGSFALAAMLSLPTMPAFAAEQTPVAAPAAPIDLKPETTWRRYAFPAALVGSGLGLLTGVGFFVASRGRTDEFNSHNDKMCKLSAPDNGGPGCTDLLNDAHSAERWSKVGLGVAAALAVTALVLKLTEPAETSTSPGSRASAAPKPVRLACAPGFGLSASCAMTF
jgi:hypothetical protein